jgi:DNA polymerase elongation subunit (family B)
MDIQDEVAGPIEFQIIDWNHSDYDFDECDLTNNDNDIEDNGNGRKTTLRYLIKMFGRMRDGRSVSVNVRNYTPSFYVKLPVGVKKSNIDSIKEIFTPYLSSIHTIKLIKRKDFWGFTNNADFFFLHINFLNVRSLRMMEKILTTKTFRVSGIGRWTPKLYQSNIEPYLRFIHAKNIRSCGWVRIETYDIDEEIQRTTCDINVSVDWKDVESIESSDTAPFVLSSFDIECTSSHGDFPVPKKDYLKTSRELLELYRKSSGLTPTKLHETFVKALTNIYNSQPSDTADLSIVYPKRNVNLKAINRLFKEHASDIINICGGLVQIHVPDDVFDKVEDDNNIVWNIRRDELYDSTVAESVEGDDADRVEGDGAAGDIDSDGVEEDGYDVDEDAEDGGDDADADDDADDLDAAHTAFQRYFGKSKSKNEDAVKLANDKIVKQLNYKLTHNLPALEGDPVIQISLVAQKVGEFQFERYIFTLDTCDPIPGIIVYECKTERELIIKWAEKVAEVDPDIITGYNIFGFDLFYLYSRAKELGITKQFLQPLSRILSKPSEYVVKQLASSALGDNVLRIINMPGRVSVDLMKVVQKDHKLDSYKLDSVAGYFMMGNVLESQPYTHRILSDNIYAVEVGTYLRLDTHKMMVTGIEPAAKKGYWITFETAPPPLDRFADRHWYLAKDDITPQQIFACQAGTSTDRALIAKYCVQDCNLCNYLVMKLSILPNNFGMATVCSVPLSYIFMRGQGIKIFSFVTKICNDKGYLIPTIRPDEKNNCLRFEGAIVLDLEPGIYIDEPISVLDYASLYPSCMISENISQDTIVLDPQYDNLPGVEYVDIEYDEFKEVVEWSTKPDGKKVSKKSVVKTGVRYCRFAQNNKGIIPLILQDLLVQRKLTRKRIEEQAVVLTNGKRYVGNIVSGGGGGDAPLVFKTAHETLTFEPSEVDSVGDAYDDFQKAVFDGLQLAYKITANSVYGQMGAKTSSLYMQDIAACTTAMGRRMILNAKEFLENKYDVRVIYGDTDSLFCIFKNEVYDEETGRMRKLLGKEAISASIANAQKASKDYRETRLKRPHDLEYEKTFYPFIIFAKKKYVGNKYEFDNKKYKQTSMGIVLKRRDNANILKHIYGGVLDILLDTQNIPSSLSFLNKQLTDLIEGRVSLEQLIITRQLRGMYADPKKIAHKVLADRMKERDPGSAPQTNDRIPFVYILTSDAPKGTKVLQGDRIEHPAWIREKNLQPDYHHYITNQIMNPLCQLFALVLPQLPGYKARMDTTIAKTRELVSKGKTANEIRQHIYKDKCNLAEVLLFQPFLKKLENKKKGQTEIDSFFRPSSSQAKGSTKTVLENLGRRLESAAPKELLEPLPLDIASVPFAAALPKSTTSKSTSKETTSSKETASKEATRPTKPKKVKYNATSLVEEGMKEIRKKEREAKKAAKVAK